MVFFTHLALMKGGASAAGPQRVGLQVDHPCPEFRVTGSYELCMDDKGCYVCCCITSSTVLAIIVDNIIIIIYLTIQILHLKNY